MDGHDTDHRLLAGFLAGELGPADARRWDEHLLECEQCWRAVREDRAGRQAAELLREPAPAGLADRVAFTVAVAAASGPAARPWFARLGKLGLYCLNGPQSELVAAPVPMTELATLAARLPPG